MTKKIPNFKLPVKEILPPILVIDHLKVEVQTIQTIYHSIIYM